MMETNKTWMEEVEPRVIFVQPLHFEVIENIIDGYAKNILECDMDNDSEKWGTLDNFFVDEQ